MREKLKRLQELSFIDWIKIMVAIDITGVGIGLIFGFPLHVFANLLGWVSRLVFGFLYLFTAFLIFSRVLYAHNLILHSQGRREGERRTPYEEDAKFLKRILHKGMGWLRTLMETLNRMAQEAIDAIDSFLDRLEFFLEDKKEEIKEEVVSIIKDDTHQSKRENREEDSAL